VGKEFTTEKYVTKETPEATYGSKMNAKQTSELGLVGCDRPRRPPLGYRDCNVRARPVEQHCYWTSLYWLDYRLLDIPSNFGKIMHFRR